MDKTEESLVDEIWNCEIPTISFIRIGQSLYMPGEIDKEEPKVIPKRNLLNILSKNKSSIVKGKNDKKK